MCEPIRFAGVIPEVYKKLIDIAHVKGVTIEGVTATEGSYHFTWIYDEPNNRLTVTCIKHPLFIPCGMINVRMTNIVVGAVNGITVIKKGELV